MGALHVSRNCARNHPALPKQHLPLPAPHPGRKPFPCSHNCYLRGNYDTSFPSKNCPNEKSESAGKQNKHRTRLLYNSNVQYYYMRAYALPTRPTPQPKRTVQSGATGSRLPPHVHNRMRDDRNAVRMLRPQPTPHHKLSPPRPPRSLYVVSYCPTLLTSCEWCKRGTSHPV